MPGMDGLELIRRVRALQPNTHCILLTAYGEFQYAQEAIRLGVDNYLLKPVAREEVCQTVQAALDNIYRNRSPAAKIFCAKTPCAAGRQVPSGLRNWASVHRCWGGISTARASVCFAWHRAKMAR